MLGDFSCKMLLLLLGYAYPAYKTFKVVQLPATRSNDTLLRHWCCYWALMAVFTTVQPLADTFCFWLPLYYEAKLVLAVYLWANELSGTQYVWARWAQPLVSSYEPLFDRWLADSKALAKDWLHSNSLRLLTLAQHKFFAWLAQIQQQGLGAGDASAAVPPARRTRAAPKRTGSKTRRTAIVEEEVEELEEDDGAEEEDREEAAAGSRGKKAGKQADAVVPPERVPSRFTSFSLASFYSARSADLQADDVRAGLKAFPIIADAKDD